MGRTVRIDEVPTTIIGVMPALLDFPRETEVWKPLIPSDDFKKRENRRFTLYGHVADRSTLRSASTKSAASCSVSPLHIRSPTRTSAGA